MRVILTSILAGFSLLILGAATAGDPAQFVEDGQRAGLRFQFRNSPTSRKYLIETMGGGIAIFDFDGDGWPDIFLVNGAALKDPQPPHEAPDKSAPEYWNRLYHNNRDGTFTDVTAKAGLRGSGYGMGAAAGDYDNDGFPDLLVTNYGGAILYHNNGDGTFTDVTDAAHLKTTGWTTGAGFFDYDNDGCLDLFIGRYLEWDFASGGIFCGVDKPGARAYCHPDEFKPVSNYLFRGNCHGQFTDISEASHIAAAKGKSLGVTLGDFDGDGRLDIFVANDSYPQQLFRNNGDGTFTETGVPAGVGYNEDGHVFSGMGAATSDLDGDGYPDILATALPYEYFALFHNQRDGTFAYSSVSTGLAQLTRPYGGWGIHVFDFDNDGLPEVFLANSHVMDNIAVTQAHLRYMEPPVLLRYAAGKFTDISAGSGEVFRQSWAARGAAFGDLDNDGDIDIVVSDYAAPVHLLRNQGGNRNHWLALDLRGTRSNRDAIGAKVRLTTATGKVQYGLVSRAGSYLCSNDPRVYFGTGTESEIREVAISWPAGDSQTIQHPKADQILRVTEESPDTFQQGMALAKQGKMDEAASAFREAIRQKPDFLEAHFALGVLLARQGRARYGPAMQEFLEVLRLNPRDVDAHINLSNLLEQEGDFAASAGEMLKAVALIPERGDLELVLARKQYKAARYTEAVESYRAAIRLNAPSAEAHYGLGLTLRALRRMTEAAAEFRAVIAANPRHTGAHYELGRLLAGEEDYAGAASHLAEAASLDPAMAEASLELGKAYHKQKKLPEAETAFQAALAAKPDLSPALYELASLAKERGDSARAREYFARIRQLDRNRMDATRANELNADGIRLMNEGKLPEALAAFGKALESDPAFAIAAYNKGVVLAHQGARDSAVAAFEEAIRIRPAFRAAHYALGLLLKSRGDARGAEELRTAEMLKSVVGADADQGLAEAGATSP
ncbi:MAG: FG-GAP-like repeat-containing protein [Bryobacteraceae bacterium]